jgi:hypothetical protein
MPLVNEPVAKLGSHGPRASDALTMCCGTVSLNGQG